MLRWKKRVPSSENPPWRDTKIVAYPGSGCFPPNALKHHGISMKKPGARPCVIIWRLNLLN
jgi:hypothetical protein